MTETMLIGVAASFLAGSFGYILFQFWLRPMLKYRRIKRRVIKALAGLATGEADAAGPPNETAGSSRDPRKDALRQIASALSACYSEQLPDWYQLLLRRRREFPLDAAATLMKLSNTRQRVHTDRQIAAIRQSLNLSRPGPN